MTPDRLLDAKQVAEMLGVPKTWVYEQSRRGAIPTVTLGRYRRYRLAAIEAWVRERESPVPTNRPPEPLQRRPGG